MFQKKNSPSKSSLQGRDPNGKLIIKGIQMTIYLCIVLHSYTITYNGSYHIIKNFACLGLQITHNIMLKWKQPQPKLFKFIETLQRQ